MLKLNVQQKTKKGETVFPIAVDGDSVICIIPNGNTVYKKLNDFDDSPEIKVEKEVIIATPMESQNNDSLFDKKDYNEDNEIFEEETEETTSTNNTSPYGDGDYI